MDIYKETSVRKQFSRGYEFNIIVVNDGEQIDEQMFSKKTHQIEELLEFINYNENSDYEVYL
jgi:hypothetical protein|tara:strand:- start:653 stop:838 length:186 start_codon:yes stop_codon:yes gene_type:complete